MRLGSAIWRTIKGAALAVPFFAASFHAHAIVCPDGQATFYEVDQFSPPVSPATAPGSSPGPVGRKYNALSEVKTAFDAYVPEASSCGVASREWWKLGNAHPSTSLFSSGNGGTYWHSYRRECSTSGGGGVSGFAQVRVLEKCQVPVCTTQPGTDMGLQSLASYNRGDTSACVSGCVVSRVLAFEFTPAGATPSSGYRWQATGAACTSQPNTVPSADSCRSGASTSGGTMVGCAVNLNKGLMSDGKRPNEKTVDPSDFEYSGALADTMRDEGCVTTASGRVLCISSAPSAAKPDNGTPGVPATPDATVVYTQPYGVTNNTTTTIHHYSSTTVNNSTNYGAGAPDQPDGQGAADGDGTCEYGENSNSFDCSGDGDGDGEGDGATCGGPDLPPCNVKIDEEGVADEWEAMFDRLETAEAEFETERTEASTALTTQVAAESPATGWSPLSFIPDLPDNACQTITVEFFNGETKSFPPPILCDAIETWFKPTLAFFLYLFTILGILYSAMRSATGNT